MQSGLFGNRWKSSKDDKSEEAEKSDDVTESPKRRLFSRLRKSSKSEEAEKNDDVTESPKHRLFSGLRKSSKSEDKEKDV